MPRVELLRIGPGQRALAIGMAVLIPTILLVMLLSFHMGKQPERAEQHVSVVSISIAGAAAEAPEPDSVKHEQAKEQPEPPQLTPPEPPALPPLPVIVPHVAPTVAAPTESAPASESPRIGVRPPGGAVYGPPDTRGSSSARDTERVGTAPNGEPLYAAAWYREPKDDELRGYLATASGPGWGLIACRTAPDFRVEDCVALDEYPNGSQINRAVLAAAWQFRVRPPRIGGQSQVGAWVRIRIDYSIRRW